MIDVLRGGFHIVISAQAPAASQVSFNSHIYCILPPNRCSGFLLYIEAAPSGLVNQRAAHTERFKLNKRAEISWKPPLSLIPSLAQLFSPWGSISSGPESMRGTFLCHIPSLEGSVSLEERRLGYRTQRREGGIRNDLSGHGRPVLWADRWSETSHFINEGISSATAEERSTRHLKSCFNAHQQCIYSCGAP